MDQWTFFLGYKPLGERTLFMEYKPSNTTHIKRVQILVNPNTQEEANLFEDAEHQTQVDYAIKQYAYLYLDTVFSNEAEFILAKEQYQEINIDFIGREEYYRMKEQEGGIVSLCDRIDVYPVASLELRAQTKSTHYPYLVPIFKWLLKQYPELDTSAFSQVYQEFKDRLGEGTIDPPCELGSCDCIIGF